MNYLIIQHNRRDAHRRKFLFSTFEEMMSYMDHADKNYIYQYHFFIRDTRDHIWHKIQFVGFSRDVFECVPL